VAVFGDKGAADLSRLRQEKVLLMQKNDRLEAENRDLLRQIDRLKNEDLGFIESIARQELGMVKDNEVILKLPDKKK
jgi:cell division protein FtsB